KPNGRKPSNGRCCLLELNAPLPRIEYLNLYRGLIPSAPCFNSEEDRLAAGKNLRPSMRDFALAAIQLRDTFRRTAICGYFPCRSGRRRGEINGATRSPTTSEGPRIA